MTDFGSDHAFGKVNVKLLEHYGITVPTSAVRRITEYHAEQISDALSPLDHDPSVRAQVVIGECDGSMVPVVATGQTADGADWDGDKRKKKRLFWKEARLSLAHAKGSNSPYFAGTMGSVEESGKQLMQCVTQAGADQNSEVHCVGDGARWIANQVEECFGSNGHYLIDFYHLCEYLSAAAAHCSPKKESSWLEEQKQRMKSSEHQKVLLELEPHLESQEAAESEAPVRACYRYIKNRPDQLDYKRAMNEDLPIGSGEIESAHRYVIQERLKIAGAWWCIKNVGNMINLRVCRANNEWDDYWKQVV